jgi:5'-nucleotidase
MRCILVSNDDGVEADGLRALAETLTALGDVTVVAPAENCSAVSHAVTVRRPLQLRKVSEAWYSVDGTPTDCVNLAISEVMGRVPDLVVSGINNGLNVGDDVTYSGTVAGALEGVLFGAPALAVSLQRSSEAMDYVAAAQVARQLAEAVLNQGLPPWTLLNVNVPRSAHHGIRATVQARRIQAVRVPRPSVAEDPSSVCARSTELDWEPNMQSDYATVLAGWVSVTPLHTDWTNHSAMEAIDALTVTPATAVD